MSRTLRIAAAAVAATVSSFAAVNVQKVNWQGWPNCYRISNGEVEMIVTTDVGPRIMRYAFLDGPNVFAEFSAELGKSGEAKWMPRGGHRIWIAPEDRVLSYPADNFPVRATVTEDGIELAAPVEKETGLQKTIIVKMQQNGTQVDVVHRITNQKKVPMELAPWALTMMAPGGIAITGFPPRGTHPEVLAPTNPLVMWAFTDLTDPRWVAFKKYIVLKQDRNAKSPQKIGHFNPDTWGAYLLNDHLFVKKYKADPKKRYPDFNCSYETFTNAEFLELETLGPLVAVKPMESVEHTETWMLHKGVRISSLTEGAIDAVIRPLID